MTKRKLFDISLIILVVALYRLMPHVPNVAPITALALYSGVHLDRRLAIVLPLVVMFVSDLIIGFHGTMIFVYLSFLVSSLIGIWLKKRAKARNIVAGTLLASILFFVITNIGVWIEGRMYERTLEGLRDCFILALPFFRNTLGGDMLFTGLFFILHAILEQLTKSQRLSKI